MGQRASNTATISFDEVEIPAENLLGEENKGFKLAMMTLDRTRPGVSAMAVGIGRAALEYATEYSKERVQFGVPIAMHQAIQFMIADMATKVEAGRLLVWNSAVLLDQGVRNSKVSSMAKRFAADSAMEITVDAVQVYGGYGFIKEYPVEKLMRDAKIMQLYEGTSQIQRLVIAKEVLLPRQRRRADARRPRRRPPRSPRAASPSRPPRRSSSTQRSGPCLQSRRPLGPAAFFVLGARYAGRTTGWVGERLSAPVICTAMRIKGREHPLARDRSGLAALAARQHGVVSIRQLTGPLGYSRSAVDRASMRDVCTGSIEASIAVGHTRLSVHAAVPGGGSRLRADALLSHVLGRVALGPTRRSPHAASVSDSARSRKRRPSDSPARSSLTSRRGPSTAEGIRYGAARLYLDLAATVRFELAGEDGRAHRRPGAL